MGTIASSLTVTLSAILGFKVVSRWWPKQPNAIMDGLSLSSGNQEEYELVLRSELAVLESRAEDWDRQVQLLVGEVLQARREMKEKDEIIGLLRQDLSQSRYDKTAQPSNTTQGGISHDRPRSKKRHTTKGSLSEVNLTLASEHGTNGNGASLNKPLVQSEEDAIWPVKRLNEAIVQNATLLANVFEFGNAENSELEDGEEVSQAAQRFMGLALIDMLRSTNHDRSRSVVLVAFQACMVEFTRWITQGWTFDDIEDDYLNGVYLKIAQKETPIESGQWRALTRRHLQQPVNEEAINEQFVPILAEAFFAILILAHCVDKPSYIDIVLAEAKSQMASLVVAALQLNRLLGVDIVAADYALVSVHPGEEFAPGRMDEAFLHGSGNESFTPPPDSGTSPRPVLATTQLGLRRVTWARNMGDRLVETNILKATVVLDGAC